MKSETSKYFTGHWVLCCLQCSSLKVSSSELWVKLLCSYSSPPTPFLSFQIFHFHLRCSQASLPWCVSSVGPCPWRSGAEGALLPCPLTPTLVSSLHGMASFSSVFLQLFPDLRTSKKELKKFSWSSSWLLMSSLLSCWPEDVPQGQLVLVCAISKPGSGQTPLTQTQDLTWRSEKGSVLCTPQTWVLAQLTPPLAVTRDQGWLALRMTLHKSIHQHQDETHFMALLILQATQQTLPKIP